MVWVGDAVVEDDDGSGSEILFDEHRQIQEPAEKRRGRYIRMMRRKRDYGREGEFKNMSSFLT